MTVGRSDMSKFTEGSWQGSFTVNHVTAVQTLKPSSTPKNALREFLQGRNLLVYLPTGFPASSNMLQMLCRVFCNLADSSSVKTNQDLQRVQNRCLNVIGLPRDTVESLVTRRQNLTRKEFKRILESEAHPCKRFLDKPVDHGHNLRSCKTNPAHLTIEGLNGVVAFSGIG